MQRRNLPAIALVLHRWDARAGGLEKWTADLARYLLARGYAVHVVATDFAQDSADPADAGRAIQRHQIEASTSPLIVAERIDAALRTVAADIVHDTGSGWSGHVFQPQTGSRLLCLDAEVRRLDPLRRLRHLTSRNVRRWRREMAELERRQLASARRIVAVSRFVIGGLERRYGVPPERMTLIPNGVDIDRFQPLTEEAERQRRRCALGLGGGVLFTMVANNFRLKGVDTALAAVAHLARTGKPAQLAVAGSGPVDFYRRRSERLGIGDRVSFLGHVDRVHELLAASDVFLQPTEYDACSLTTLEALASGLPTITTRMNGASELMADGLDGFVLEKANDAASLAAAMAQLLPEEQRREMGVAARKAALAQRAEFGFRRIEEVYRQVLAGAVEPAALVNNPGGSAAGALPSTARDSWHG